MSHKKQSLLSCFWLFICAELLFLCCSPFGSFSLCAHPASFHAVKQSVLDVGVHPENRIPCPLERPEATPRPDTMQIENPEALRTWLTAFLEPL